MSREQLTEHDRSLRTAALARADHPDRVPGGYLTVYRAGDPTGPPIGFAERVLSGWSDPMRWRAVLVVEGREVAVGDRYAHRCGEDAERAIRLAFRELSGEAAHAAENVVWL